MIASPIRLLAQTLAIVVLGAGAAVIHAARNPITIHTAQPVTAPDTPGAPDTQPQGPIKTITVEAAVELFNSGGAAFIDARELEDYKLGHVPGAHSLPFAEFLKPDPPEVVNFLPPDLPIVLYCEGGDCHSSHQVADMLVDYGFSDLRILESGWPSWDDAGYPVETGDPPLSQ